MSTDADLLIDLTADEASRADDAPIDVDAGLRLDHLVRRFGSVKAVDNVSLHVPPGTLVSFLGPSGCGKTTLLRLIAGLDRPNDGKVLLDGEDLTSTPAHQRDIGMVFQSLALFPHLNVRRNIGYGLKIRRASKSDIDHRVDELLSIVDLDGLADRKVSQLSGGQRQRVAIARALARDPALFLLDEPMSALDANLRESLQVELRLLQQQLGITTVMVTHDQREAMTMSDIIVVMNRGQIEQVGPPVEVYRNPNTAFSARFLGSTNLLRGRRASPGTATVDGTTFELGNDRFPMNGRDVVISARPSDIVLSPANESASSATGSNQLRGTVTFVRDLGATFECFVDTGRAEPLIVQGASRDLGSTRQGDEVELTFPPKTCVVVNESSDDDLVAAAEASDD